MHLRGELVANSNSTSEIPNLNSDFDFLKQGVLKTKNWKEDIQHNQQIGGFEWRFRIEVSRNNYKNKLDYGHACSCLESHG